MRSDGKWLVVEEMAGKGELHGDPGAAMAGGQGTPKSGEGRGGPALEMGQMVAPVNGEDP